MAKQTIDLEVVIKDEKLFKQNIIRLVKEQLQEALDEYFKEIENEFINGSGDENTVGILKHE